MHFVRALWQNMILFDEIWVFHFTRQSWVKWNGYCATMHSSACNICELCLLSPVYTCCFWAQLNWFKFFSMCDVKACIAFEPGLNCCSKKLTTSCFGFADQQVPETFFKGGAETHSEGVHALHLLGGLCRLCLAFPLFPIIPSSLVQIPILTYMVTRWARFSFSSEELQHLDSRESYNYHIVYNGTSPASLQNP